MWALLWSSGRMVLAWCSVCAVKGGRSCSRESSATRQRRLGASSPDVAWASNRRHLGSDAHALHRQVNGLFFAIGHEPASKFLEGQLELDEDGYIKTTPGHTTTNVPGQCGVDGGRKVGVAGCSAGSTDERRCATTTVPWSGSLRLFCDIVRMQRQELHLCCCH